MKLFPISKFPNFQILLLLAAMTATTTAQTSHRTKTGLLISDETLSPDGRSWSHGTMLHRFVVENPSNHRREITIRIPSGGSSDGLSSLSGSVVVEAGGRSVIELPRPAVPTGWNAIVSEPGRETENFDTFSADPQRRALPLVLLSGSLSGELMEKQFETIAENYVDKLSGYYNQSDKKFSPTRLTRDPAAWPQNWLAYSPYDGVIIHSDDYAKMPAAVKTALVRYAEAGGTVVLTTPTEWMEVDGKTMLVWEPSIPEEWRGWANAFSTESPYKHQSHKIGFGSVHLPGSSDMGAWDEQVKKRVFDAMLATKKPWGGNSSYYRRYNYNSNAHNLDTLLGAIPTGGGTSVPVNLFFALLLVFVVLAGPGAVVFLAKRNKRIHLLWVVPAFSLGFSAVIFAGIFMVEGFTPTMRRHAVTLLDQKNRTAVTLGAFGVYAPSALRGGLEFDSGTEVTPLLYDAIRGARIQSGAKQAYTGGWVPPRMSAFFHLRRAETRHERLMITENDDGTVEVVNALGADIEQLILSDTRAKHHSYGKIKAGEKVVLTRHDDVLNKESKDWFWEAALLKAYDSSAGWDYDNISKNIFNVRPGPMRNYIVRLSSCPFIENPLSNRTTKGTEEAVVVGRY